MPEIDLNADLGEGGAHDAEILACVSSANIACGAHAGDAATMRTTLRAARAAGVAIGAHPGYPDRAHFGRRALDLPAAELRASLIAQITQLAQIAAEEGACLTHVKVHGALYNQCAQDEPLAATVLAAIAAVDERLAVYGLAGGALTRLARTQGLNAVEEVFADRAYLADGTLAPRSLPGAVLAPDAACTQALALALQQPIAALDGTLLTLPAHSLCLHGDSPEALTLALTLHAQLAQHGVLVRPPFFQH